MWLFRSNFKTKWGLDLFAKYGYTIEEVLNCASIYDSDGVLAVILKKVLL